MAHVHGNLLMAALTQGYGPFVSQFAQGAGQLVGAAGTPAVAVYSFQTGNDILNLHASYK